jgi:hypothetical protein
MWVWASQSNDPKRNFRPYPGKTGGYEHIDFVTENVPEGSGNSVLPSNVGALQQRGSPGPMTNDNGRRQSGLDHAAGRAVRQ